ncbi:hypothetical protein PG987_013798 [Apiospora arundinis]
MSMGLCNWAPRPLSLLSHPTSSAQTTAFFDAMLGRQPSSAPAHLSRVPYILPHDRHTTHLPMYEADDSYRHAVGGSQLGSAPYAMKLSTASNPWGDGISGRVACHGNRWGAAAPDAGMKVGQPGCGNATDPAALVRWRAARISIESPKASVKAEVFLAPPLPSPSHRPGLVK